MSHLRTDCSSSPAKLSRDPFWTLHPRGWIICKLWYPNLTLVSYHCGLHCWPITIFRGRDVEMLFCHQLLSRPKENKFSYCEGIFATFPVALRAFSARLYATVDEEELKVRNTRRLGHSLRETSRSRRRRAISIHKSSRLRFSPPA